MAFVSLPGQEIASGATPVFPLEQIKEIRPNEVDDILLALPPGRFSEFPGILSVVDRFCLPVRAVIDLGENVSIRNRLFQLGHLQMFDLTVTPAESIEYSLLKRTFDIAFSIFVLFLMAPIMVIIAIAVRLDSRGPILFAQDRVGLNGRLFRMYKFRTMKVAAPTVSDSVWTTPNDSRCTRVGRFLRKTSLDELPQFLNVLRGDMSVVGPRPERPRFVHKFLREVAQYNSRHRLKVGITGWAQVNGWRGDTSIQKRVECDLYYLQNWSFVFDLQIIFQTFFAGIRGKNAY
jgi:Undecaprenyl-phosphate glucose phosphotransferase